jgi:hypothetical protein
MNRLLLDTVSIFNRHRETVLDVEENNVAAAVVHESKVQPVQARQRVVQTQPLF